MRKQIRGLQDVYDDVPKTTPALELRDFSEAANSFSPNVASPRPPDGKATEVADTFIISNTNLVNSLFGLASDGHAGLLIIPDDGNPENNFLWDPNGSYPSKEFGSDRTLWGPGVSLKDYVRFQKKDGPAVTVHQLDTNDEHETEIQDRVEQIGGSPLTEWGIPFMGCAAGVSRAINGVGPFGTVDETMWPSKLKEQLERAKRYKRKFEDM
ncbi:hypothetical protein U8C32_12700 [Sinorhizobium medicae]|uniref:hypothetical protein n=1 Tax=Sinorhizobium medicae TaxID=110321 RepID=UPI002AF6BC30|nr:hypothetical protein [Sinorhizobium medicae]WQO44132.1 hypothetical protein U8C42_12850 [Sinorhizobium medicae]WQO66890.1 hypothetical protein U8C40_07040 [Sinorhizobium medicae]WQO71283.1 hypothetical protein U8C31_13335 [Sinorhizobium medicae]WQO90702.1 hypothetical protein U8C32_12700 [Sinorhizobium medicae]